MDRHGFAFTHDLLCVLVAVVSMSVLLVELAHLYVANHQQSEQSRLMDDARDICERLLDYMAILHDAERGVFERAMIDNLDVDSLQQDLRIGSGFSLRIMEVTGGGMEEGRSWSWSTGEPAENVGACVTSASIHDGGYVSPVRIVLWIWRT